MVGSPLCTALLKLLKWHLERLSFVSYCGLALAIEFCLNLQLNLVDHLKIRLTNQIKTYAWVYLVLALEVLVEGGLNHANRLGGGAELLGHLHDHPHVKLVAHLRWVDYLGLIHLTLLVHVLPYSIVGLSLGRFNVALWRRLALDRRLRLQICR